MLAILVGVHCPDDLISFNIFSSKFWFFVYLLLCSVFCIFKKIGYLFLVTHTSSFEIMDMSSLRGTCNANICSFTVVWIFTLLKGSFNEAKFMIL